MSVAHDVNAWTFGYIIEERSIQDGSGSADMVLWSPFGRLGKGQQFFSRFEAGFAGTLSQPQSASRGEFGVESGSMDFSRIEADRFRDGVQTHFSHVREQTHGETHDVDPLVDQPGPVERRQLAVDESEVEADVMSKQRRGTDERLDGFGYVGKSRRVLDRFIDIPVSFVMNVDMGRSGLTNDSKRSTSAPAAYLIKPISMTLCWIGRKPVVSTRSRRNHRVGFLG